MNELQELVEEVKAEMLTSAIADAGYPVVEWMQDDLEQYIRDYHNVEPIFKMENRTTVHLFLVDMDINKLVSSVKADFRFDLENEGLGVNVTLSILEQSALDNVNEGFTDYLAEVLLNENV